MPIKTENGFKLKKPENFGSLFGPIDESAVIASEKVGAVDEPDRLPLKFLVPYRNHPFKLYEGKRMEDLIESVKANGVLEPLIVLKHSDTEYEILAGHNRKAAAEVAGEKEVPVVIKENLTDEEAELIVTETNLYQRSISDMSHSERARVLSAHMNAVRSQGKRNDLINEVEALMKSHNDGENSTLCQIGTKLDSLQDSAEKYGLTRRNIARYLRIAKLDQELLDLLDDDRFGIVAGVELSYVSDASQEYIARRLDEVDSYKLDIKKAETIRSVHKEGKLSNEIIEMILNGTYNTAPQKKTLGTKTKNINLGFAQKYFAPTQSKKEIEEYVTKALEFYMEHEAEIEARMAEAEEFEL